MILSVLSLPVRVVAFTIWFLAEIVKTSCTVMWDAIRPGSDATPRVVRMPVGTDPDWHVTLISMLITLTPGTLTLGVAPPEDGEGRALMVHAMYFPDNPSAVSDLDSMYRRMQRAVTVAGGAR
ncbi:Na+/H+ antiporter subunit E [Brachybacterium sp. AOP43-C2-M15]|uniref:Na+/H+ antiporter subunit E n=1 Tax=Brachybacterium sp. AOP43-C2-M15 TaxID=3457661 RepID=UPI004033D888